MAGESARERGTLKFGGVGASTGHRKAQGEMKRRALEGEGPEGQSGMG